MAFEVPSEHFIHGNIYLEQIEQWLVNFKHTTSFTSTTSFTHGCKQLVFKNLIE